MLFQEVSKRRVAFIIEDDNVTGLNRNRVADGDGEVPKPLAVESVSGIQSGELPEVVSDRELGVERELAGNWLPGVVEGGQCLAEFFFSGSSFFCRGSFVK